MVSRITLLAAISGALTLGCKSPDTGDTDTAGSSSTTATTSTSVPTTLDPTTMGPTTGSATEPTTGEPATTTGGTMGGSTTELTTDATTMDLTTGPAGPCKPIACEGATYACGDCMDNDGDGKVDLLDPECISPCDNREDTFATGLPGDNMDPCKQDCFFDGNSGNDACDWNLGCDPMNPGGDKCPYGPKKTCSPPTPECAETCGVPNGCDCFGCCTIVVGGVSHDIFIGDMTCSADKIEDCQKCTKNDDCDEECNPENCEVCFGGELPPECEDPTCESGEPCTLDKEGNSNCAEGTYCQTGCCVPIVPG
jgi:hypothetical protein